MNKNTNSKLKYYLCKHSLKKTGQFFTLTLLFCMSVLPNIANADFNPILISDGDDHLIYKITGASSFADLTGEDLNDGAAPDIEEVGAFPQGYNIQDLAKDNAGDTWALAIGLGTDGATRGHAYIGQITESAGSYSFTDIRDLGETYLDTSSYGLKQHGKALVWDPDNQYFIYEANPTWNDTLKATFKAYDPATDSVLADPWGTGNAAMVIALPISQTATHAQGLAFSPDGELYAAMANHPAYILKLERNANDQLTGNSTLIGASGLGQNIHNIEALNFDSNGRMIIMVSNGGASGGKGKVYTLDLTTELLTEIADLDNGSGSNRDWEGIVFSKPEYSPKLCYAMTDDVAELYSFDMDSSTPPTKVNTSRVFNGEGAAYRATDNAIYTFDQVVQSSSDPSDLYKVELDGTVTLIKTNFLSRRAAGAEFIRYTDGTERFVVLQNEFDSEIVIYDAQDLTDNTPISTTPLLFPDGTTAKVSSLAINPANGEVLVAEDGLNSTDVIEIYSVDMTSGQLTLKTILTVLGIDAESLAFASDGELYVENEDKAVSAYDHKIFRVDLTTGDLTVVEDNIDSVITGDIEAMSCTGSKILTPVAVGISGTIFQDDNTNDTQDGIESGLTNIAVSLYEDINNDGAIDIADNLIGIASSDTNGNYSFGSLADGDYLVQVNSTDSSLATGLVLGGTNPLDVTVSGSGVADQDFPFDLTGCTALSGTINAGLASSLQISTGDKIFLGSTTVATETGHLKAFTVNASGTPATDASWDVADQMTPVERDARLYSSDDSGDKILFASLDDAAFDTNGLPTVTTIKNTIKTATLGALSDNSSLALIDDRRNVFTYLSDSSYRSFITSNDTRRSSRTKRVLASSNDGFLYAFNQSDGDLGWGWIPRSLVEGLKYPATFSDYHYMQGEIDVLDLKHSGSFRSYVIGSYKQGLGQYVLRLSNDTSSNLDAVIWDVDHSATEMSVPNQGRRAYFKDGNDSTYTAYVTSGASANSSILHIRSLASSTTRAIPLTFNATSTAYVMDDVGSITAKSIYLGDDVGSIYSASLLDVNQALESAANIQTDINDSAVAALDVSDSSAVLFIGSSKSSTDHTIHLRAQSGDRLTIFKYDSGTSSWTRKWTSYVGGANKWSSDGSVVADTSIQALPSDAHITDNAYVVANSIVLPVTLDPANNQCSGLSYYYLYQLDNGHFPSNRFYTTSESAINSNIAIGKGNAQTLHFANLLGSSQMMGSGMSDQTTNGATGISTQFIIKDPISTGVRSWREL